MIELQCSPQFALRASCVTSLTPSIFFGRNGIRFFESLSRANKHSADVRRDSWRRNGGSVIARMAAGAKTPGSNSIHTSILFPKLGWESEKSEKSENATDWECLRQVNRGTFLETSYKPVECSPCMNTFLLVLNTEYKAQVLKYYEYEPCGSVSS